MAVPETLEDLKAAGYVFDNEGICKGCGAEIEWFITPNGRKSPMSVVPLDKSGAVVQPGSLVRPFRFVRRSHFSDCPNREDFRKRKT